MRTNDVDLVRLRVFSQKTRDVERIPPTSDALYQHLKRSVFQASIWTTAQMSMMPVNNPTDHGWKEEDGKLLPIWISQPLARDVFQLDVKCTCTSTCSRCKCMRAKLKCTRLCKCKCEKELDRKHFQYWHVYMVDLLDTFLLKLLFKELFMELPDTIASNISRYSPLYCSTVKR
jgi:hypothetical protein